MAINGLNLYVSYLRLNCTRSNVRKDCVSQHHRGSIDVPSILSRHYSIEGFKRYHSALSLKPLGAPLIGPPDASLSWTAEVCFFPSLGASIIWEEKTLIKQGESFLELMKRDDIDNNKHSTRIFFLFKK